MPKRYIIFDCRCGGVLKLFAESEMHGAIMEVQDLYYPRPEKSQTRFYSCEKCGAVFKQYWTEPPRTGPAASSDIAKSSGPFPYRGSLSREQIIDLARSERGIITDQDEERYLASARGRKKG